jgi:CDP-diacylglycerol--inositol 3-phosphatidyltransferase
MSQKVILYVPNIIGYTRLVLLFMSMFSAELVFVSLYLTSVSLDYFDGMIARYLGETSELGKVLDMVTDRISTTVLCIKVVNKKPNHLKRCLVFIFIDLLSHFIYFTSMIYKNTHHKSFKDNFFVKIYYEPSVLKLMCSGTEIYFLALYYFKKEGNWLNVLGLIPLMKTFFHLVHLYIGVYELSNVPEQS